MCPDNTYNAEMNNNNYYCTLEPRAYTCTRPVHTGSGTGLTDTAVARTERHA